jgi:hypothetical protein
MMGPMPPQLTARFRLRALRIAVAIGVAAGVLAGCTAGASFDPAAPCSKDARLAGAYPALEALVPKRFRDRGPDRVDSGRSCTQAALGSLVVHGVSELRFAGAVWDLGSGSGVTEAILDADGLTVPWVEEFYKSGAEAAKETERVDSHSVALPGSVSGFRIDTLNGESYQSVLVWPDGGHVRVIIVASFIRAVQTIDAHDAVVDDAISAAFSG